MFWAGKCPAHQMIGNEVVDRAMLVNLVSWVSWAVIGSSIYISVIYILTRGIADTVGRYKRPKGYRLEKFKSKYVSAIGRSWWHRVWICSSLRYLYHFIARTFFLKQILSWLDFLYLDLKLSGFLFYRKSKSHFLQLDWKSSRLFYLVVNVNPNLFFQRLWTFSSLKSRVLLKNLFVSKTSISVSKILTLACCVNRSSV